MAFDVDAKGEVISLDCRLWAMALCAGAGKGRPWVRPWVL